MKEFDAEKLKEEYQVKPKKTNLEEAKRLDRKCKLPVYIFTYTFGIIGALNFRNWNVPCYECDWWRNNFNDNFRHYYWFNRYCYCQCKLSTL